MRIAVILPERYRGGTLRGALNIAKMIKMGASLSGDLIDVSFGHVDDSTVYNEVDFDQLSSIGIKIRPFIREDVLGKSLFTYGRRKISEDPNEIYWVFNDGISNFEECDFLVIVSDRLQHPLPPGTRYAVVAYDYIQRYVPEIFGTEKEADGNWLMFDRFSEVSRNAEFIFCTTEQTRLDCINYIGADPSKVIKMPLEFDPNFAVPHSSPIIDGEYILWTTNSTQHKNHANVILGLIEFFNHNPSSSLKVVMTGVYTHLFSARKSDDLHYNQPYATKIRELISSSKPLSDRLSILGNLSDMDYANVLSKAKLLLHGAIYDNGTYSIIEAAWFGVPSVSSSYPAIDEACQNFQVKPVLFDPHQPSELRKAVELALSSYQSFKNDLPNRELLQQRTFAVVAPQYWKLLKNAIIGQTN
jgi:glycosyltransferase involved in cell wall biosynthesis